MMIKRKKVINYNDIGDHHYDEGNYIGDNDHKNNSDNIMQEAGTQRERSVAKPGGLLAVQ